MPVFQPGAQYVGQGMNTNVFGSGPPSGVTSGFFPGFETIITEGAKYLVNQATQSSSTAGNGAAYATAEPGTYQGQFNCPPGYRIDARGNCCKTRRRRRKLLTCSDKADIAFLRGTLGGGQLGQAAISALLARRC